MCGSTFYDLSDHEKNEGKGHSDFSDLIVAVPCSVVPLDTFLHSVPLISNVYVITEAVA